MSFAPPGRRPSVVALVILFLLIVHQIFLGGLWISIDRQLAGNDETDYLQNALRHQFRIHHQDHSPGDALQRFFGYQEVTSTPPWLFVFWEILWTIFGTSPEAARGFSLFCLVLAGMALFMAVRPVGGDLGGLLACAAFFIFPPVTIFSRQASSFLPHMAAVSVVLALLCNSRLGVRPGFVIPLGLAVSVDIMVERGTPVLILAPMLIYAMVAMWRRYAKRPRREGVLALRRVVLVFAIVILFSGWYLISYVQQNFTHTYDLAVDALRQTRLTHYYTDDFIRLSLTPPMAALLALALVLLAANRELGAYRGFFAVAFLGPIFLFSRIATKDLEYLLGVLPLAAAAIGAGLSSNKRIPRALLVALLLVMIHQGAALNAHMSFGTAREDSRIGKAALRWQLLPQLPYRYPDLRGMAKTLSRRLPREPAGILYAYSEAAASDFSPDSPHLNQTQFNALQIYLAGLRPDDVHVFLITPVGESFHPRPKGVQALFAVPMSRLFGQVQGHGAVGFRIDRVTGGLFHYNGPDVEALAAERFAMARPKPLPPIPGLAPYLVLLSPEL